MSIVVCFRRVLPSCVNASATSRCAKQPPFCNIHPWKQS